VRPDSGGGRLARVQGLLLDVDGVLTMSWRALPGAPEALRRLRSLGYPVRLITNTTTLSRRSLAAVLRDAGFDVAPSDLVTAPVATAELLRSAHPGARCFLVGEPESVEDLEGVDLVEEGADVVVVSGADDGFTWDRLNRALGFLAGGASLVAMQRNMTWITDEGPKLDAGAYLLGLEAASGVAAEVAGKPSPAFFRSALALLGLPADRVAMVGDQAESDVLAAQAVGMAGVLVRTGAFRPEDLDRASGRPDAVIGGLAELPALLERG
jgi:HAD superfamily hydrolase (TIGR01458 family)